MLYCWYWNGWICACENIPFKMLCLSFTSKLDWLGLLCCPFNKKILKKLVFCSMRFFLHFFFFFFTIFSPVNWMLFCWYWNGWICACENVPFKMLCLSFTSKLDWLGLLCCPFNKKILKKLVLCLWKRPF